MKLSRRAGVAVAILAVLMPTDAASPVWKLIFSIASLPDTIIAAGQSAGSDRAAGKRKYRHIDPLQLALGGQTTSPFAPHERVLAQVRTRPPVSAGAPPANVYAFNAAGTTPGRLPGSFATFGSPPPSAPGGAPPNNTGTPPPTPGSPGSPGVSGPPGSTSPPGPPSPPGSTNPTGPIPPLGPSPVPEPATWVSMIMGMFGLGAWLRRRRGFTIGDTQH